MDDASELSLPFGLISDLQWMFPPIPFALFSPTTVVKLHAGEWSAANTGCTIVKTRHNKYTKKVWKDDTI